MFQTPKTVPLERTDHCWVAKNRALFKCCLCGAITAKPPQFPTPEDWMPARYDPLTNEERALVPHTLGAKS